MMLCEPLCTVGIPRENRESGEEFQAAHEFGVAGDLFCGIPFAVNRGEQPFHLFFAVHRGGHDILPGMRQPFLQPPAQRGRVSKRGQMVGIEREHA